MAKTFDPSTLSPSDRLAFDAWQRKAQSYLQGPSPEFTAKYGPNSVNGLPAVLSYVLVHPEYLKTHPDLTEAYNTLTGQNLPPSVKAAVQTQLGNNTNFDWQGGQAGIAKHGGVFSQPETWIQLALGGAIGGAGAAGAFSGAAGSVGAGGVTAPSLGAPAAIGAGGNLGTGALATLPGYTTSAGVLGTGTGTGLIAGGTGGTLGTIGTIGKYLDKYGKVIGAVGAGVGNAANASANNRYIQDQLALRQSELELENNRLGLSGYNANTAAQQNFQEQMVTLAQLEAKQRETGRSNLYKSSVAQNPSKSPYNTGNLPAVSDQYKAALQALADQASAKLGQSPQYDTSNIPKPTYNPYVPPPYTPPTPSSPGALENTSNWLTPVLTGIGAYYGFNPYKPGQKQA